MKLLLAWLLMLSSGAVSAQSATEAESRRLEAALSRLQQEQQSLFQQFQMIEELRRVDADKANQPPPSYTPDGSPPNYEDMTREKQAREQRVRDYGYELDRLYGRYRELEQQKKPLLDRLNELAQRP